MSEFNQARRKGIVKFGYDFNSLAEVANLLDTVSYEVNDKDRTNGDVKVWPGQKFVVKSVSPTTAICETTDDDVLAQIKSAGKASFAIPKRDIELGYFTVCGER